MVWKKQPSEGRERDSPFEIHSERTKRMDRGLKNCRKKAADWLAVKEKRAVAGKK